MNRFNLLIIPGSPAVVRQLAPRDSAGAGLLAAIRRLIEGDERPIEIVGSQSPRWYTAHTGSFRAWGAEVNVGGGNYLPELVARYCLGKAAAGRVVASRDTVQPLNPDALTVVVVDGSAGLTQRAPLALVEAANEVHIGTVAFLDGCGTLPEGLAEAGVVEPELWTQLSELDAERRAVHIDTSLGVGRYVAAWEVRA